MSVPGSGGQRLRVIAAMSGGVDSAVAAARAVEAGHDVIAAYAPWFTMTRWRDEEGWVLLAGVRCNR